MRQGVVRFGHGERASRSAALMIGWLVLAAQGIAVAAPAETTEAAAASNAETWVAEAATGGTEDEAEWTPDPAAEELQAAEEPDLMLEPAAPAAIPNAVSAVHWEAAEGGTRFIFAAESPATSYRYFQLNHPTRLILDLYGLRAGRLPDELPVGAGGVRSIRVGRHKEKVRFVLDMAEDAIPQFAVSMEPEGAVVFVEEGRGRRIPAPAKRVGARPAVTSVDFKQLAEVSRVQISMSEDVEFEVLRPNPAEYTIDFRGATVTPLLTKPLDTTYFQSYVKLVQAKARRGGVRVVVQLRAPIEANVWQEPGAVGLDFPVPPPGGPRSTEMPVAGAVAADAPFGMAAGDAEVEAVEENGTVENGEIVADDGVEYFKKGAVGSRYRGKKISLDLKDANIKDVLRLIADVSNFNIVAGDDVVGLVTVRLIDVPWDQALDVVLATHDLGIERIGNVIRIAPLDVLRAAEEKRLAAKTARAKVEDTVLRVISTSYIGADDLKKQVEAIMSPRGTVTTDGRTNSILVQDVASKMEEIEALVKILDAPTRAVHIEARIVEASTQFEEEIGIQVGGSNRGFDVGDNGTLDVVGGRSGAVGSPVDDFAINLPALTGIGTGGALSFLYKTNDAQLDVRISALESAGKAKLISSPRVTTLDNVEAFMKQGESIPFATVSDAGTETEFFEANLELKVTPHVTADERIRLEILITNDDADFSRTTGTGDPTFITQQAETQVLLDDGETTVIGGIYTHDTTEQADGVPYLKDIPVLGHLFKRRAVQDSSRELIIFITPKIVRKR